MDPKYGSATSNNSRTDALITKNETKASSPIIFLLDSKHESKSRTNSDSILNESASGSSKSSELSCSTFSSSSGYSSDDFILVNPKIESNSISLDVPSTKFPPDAKSLSKDACNNLKLNTSTSSASQVSDFASETKSPSIQVMERRGGYDPNRVPSSIFGSKSATTMDWSAASDESLFSINVSLPREYRDPWKSGELYRCVELDRNEELSKSSKLISFRHSPAVKGGEHTEKSSDTERGVVTGNLIEAGSQHESIKKETHFEEEIKLRGIPTDIKSTEPFCHVYYTRMKSRWPLCFYSYCSCGSCCSGWPSCCCTWSGCFYCKWSSWICCSCKWLTWYCCYHKRNRTAAVNDQATTFIVQPGPAELQ